jgi:hypothetical protein
LSRTAITTPAATQKAKRDFVARFSNNLIIVGRTVGEDPSSSKRERERRNDSKDVDINIWSSIIIILQD